MTGVVNWWRHNAHAVNIRVRLEAYRLPVSAYD